jgi:hypothetical protein
MPKKKTLFIRQELKENKNFKGFLLRDAILPFRFLPDVKEISVVSSMIDSLFEVFGVIRNRNKARVNIVSWRNRRYNRYILFQLVYMSTLNNTQY